MAIQQPTQALTTTLLPEYSSRSIVITRAVTDNGNGIVTTTFAAIIYPSKITYEVDSNNNPIAVYDRDETLQPIGLSPDQLMQLFGIKVTLADGTASYLGEVISNFTDQMINNSLGNVGTINTQNIDIAAVLAAQNPPPPVPSDPPTS